MAQVVIGVDLGGTNVRAQAFDFEGKRVGERCEHPSYAQNGTDAIFTAVVEAVAQARSKATSDAVAVGLSIPGCVDDESGLVKWAPNFGKTVDGVFHYWEDVQVKKPLQDRIGLPIYMGNDANLAALGEYKYGFGNNSARCLVLLTLGTGIGGGCVMSPYSVSGQASGSLMLVGGNKGGAEFGHIAVMAGGLDCNAGEYGSLEAYCQRDAIIKRAVHRLTRGRESAMRDMVNGDLSKITPLIISQAALKGDELALEVWEEVGAALGIGIGSLVNVFAPDIFVIGGNIAKAGDLILKPAIKQARNFAIPTLWKDTRVLIAKELDDAGLLGGAALAAASVSGGLA